jgi:hypothetical protein
MGGHKMTRLPFLCLISIMLAGVVDANTEQKIEAKGPEHQAYGPGDLVITAVDMPNFRALHDDTLHYAPRYSTFWIDAAAKRGEKPAWIVHFSCVPKIGKSPFRCGEKTGTPNPATLMVGSEEVPMVVRRTPYSVDEKDLSLYAPRTFGPEYGVLVSPYKFHLDDQSLSGEASVGGYVGFRIAQPGIAFTPVFSAGVGVVSVTDEQEGRPEESNRASFTVALGAITTFSRQGVFQFGVLLGWDWTGDSNYDHEGETWIALSLGSKLTR